MTAHLASLPIADVVNALVGKMYEPPLSRLRERMSDLPDPLRVLFLVSDFDTEVLMNGIVGFLENLTGAHLLATIEAFDAIGAKSTAATLRDVEVTMRQYGITHQMLRQPMADLEEFSIVSSSALHGQNATRMFEVVEKRAQDLYCYQRESPEAIFELLCQYLEPRRQELLHAAGAA
jgi:hypothetical protein